MHYILTGFFRLYKNSLTRNRILRCVFRTFDQYFRQKPSKENSSICLNIADKYPTVPECFDVVDSREIIICFATQHSERQKKLFVIVTMLLSLPDYWNQYRRNVIY